MTKTTTDPRAVAADLHEKLNQVEDRTKLLGEERDQIAFAAHVDGDAKARRRLDEINAELIALASEAASLAAALVGADRRIDAANAATRTAEERAKAERALELGTDLRDRAVALDNLVCAFFEQFDSLRAIAVELNSMGAGPSLQLVDVACRRAFISASIGTRLQLEPMLAPNKRHSFTDVAARWSETVEAFSAPRLKKEAA